MEKFPQAPETWKDLVAGEDPHPTRFAGELARVAAWPIERVFVSHGQIVETDARAAVIAAFRRFLGRAAGERTLPAPN